MESFELEMTLPKVSGFICVNYCVLCLFIVFCLVDVNAIIPCAIII